MHKERYLKNKILIPLWALFHGIILLGFAFSVLFHGGVNIDADLFNMLPSSTLGKAMGEADNRLSDSTSRNVFVLVGHEDFSRAKETAVTVYNSIKDSANFSSVSLYSGSSAIEELEGFVHPYRFSLLDENTCALLETEDGAEDFASRALANAYGSFNVTGLSYLEEDPFLLDENIVQRYLLAVQDAGTSMSAKDGVLASYYDGLWYVMLRGTLNAKGAAIASKENGIADIYSACEPLEKDGVRFVYSGTAFHSYKSSNNAMSEITKISAVSLLIVIVMLIVVFRGVIPLAASLASILISVGTAFAATLLVFGKIHVMTLLLGTSLIGSCIDYSLHFFISWKANTDLKTGDEIRLHLIKAVVLSLISTEICYLLLLFAPFGLLKQMGIFSFTGIMSSFLTVVCLFPLIPIPSSEKRKVTFVNFYHSSPLKKIPYSSLIISAGIILILGIIIGINHKSVSIKNDMSRLYTMEGRVKEDTALAAKITGYAPMGWFIIHGDTEEELLEHEEALCAQLKSLQGRGYLASSRFVPSLASQKKSVQASEKLLSLSDGQFELLGYDQSDSENYKNLFESEKNNTLLPSALSSENVPQSIKSVTDMLWLGKIEGKYYSVVLPVKVVDEEAYVRIANENGFAYYENKMKDLGSGLDKLTKLVIIIFCIAYVLIIAVLKKFYKWTHVAKIGSIPLISMLLILAVLSTLGYPVEFFALTGCILVFGLGLDYIIYKMEHMKRNGITARTTEEKLEPFAVLLSFLTTAISFGALACSTFMPVHTIGLTIFLGLVAAYVCTVF